jgi:outer membrane protein TolC
MTKELRRRAVAGTMSVLIMSAVLAAGCASTRQERSTKARSSTAAGLPGHLPRIDTNSTLGDYLAYAALNNAGLKAAFNRWKAAVERVPQARGLPDPKFNYAYFIQKVETRVGPQEHKLGLQQTFPWFGKLKYRSEAAAASAAAAKQSYEYRKLKLFERVRNAYYEYWHLGRAITITEQHNKLVANLEKVALTRYKAGTVPHSIVIQTQVELGKLKDRIESLKSLRSPMTAKLNAALNRRADLTLPWPESIPESPPPPENSQALAQLREQNPEMLRLRHLVHKEEAGTRLAGKEYYPDVTLGIDYILTDDALNPDLEDSGKDPVLTKVSLNLPVWRRKYSAAEKEAELKMKAAEQQLIDTQRQLESDLQLALYHLHDAERKISLYGNTLIPKARQSLEVTRRNFETGKATFMALMNAERMLLEFQLAHVRAKTDLGLRFAEIHTLTGTDDVTADHHGKDGEQGFRAEQQKEAKLQTKCPVMGGSINKDLYVDHNGKRIYVCCPGCIKTVENNPEKYIKELKKKGIQIHPAPADNSVVSKVL